MRKYDTDQVLPRTLLGSDQTLAGATALKRHDYGTILSTDTWHVGEKPGINVL
jgi:hypothetical protein